MFLSSDLKTLIPQIIDVFLRSVPQYLVKNYYKYILMLRLLCCREPRWKNNTSFVSRFSTRRRDRSSQVTNNVQSPMVPRQIRKAFMAGDEEISESLNR